MGTDISQISDLAPRRGRPRQNTNKQVVQRLLDATELLLRDYNHTDLTERKIAAAADVTEGMIHYYFGEKDGLLFDVIARRCDEVIEKLNTLDTTTLEPRTVTRHIVKNLIDAYYQKPWIAKIALSEIANNGSTIKDRFIKRYGMPGMGIAHLQRHFRQLIDRGVYDKAVDPKDAARCLIFIISAPLMQAPFDCSLEEFQTERWIDYIADLFGRQLLAAKHD